MINTRGFTLVELIMVIVIMGIIAAVASVFITGPVQSYFDSNRRALLTDAADIALRRISRDLRLALPNSVRVGGSNRFLEYIPTTEGGRYRTESGGNILDFTIADSSFGYLGDSLVGNTGFIVIFNTGQRSVSGCEGADAYEGCNRTAISTATPISATTITHDSIQFPFTSPGNRFFIVPASGPATLACENVSTNANGDGTGTLKIYTSYDTGNGDWGAVAPTAAPGGSSSLLAEYLSGCTFIYTTGVTATNGLVTLRLALTRNNETVTLHHQVHVNNSP